VDASVAPVLLSTSPDVYARGGKSFSQIGDEWVERMMTSDVLRQPGRCDHFVQTYTDDHHLAAVVADYLGSGLTRNEAAVMMATSPHVQFVLRRLSMLGIDVPGAIDRRQVLILDAQETLASFMIDGWPDRNRFLRIVAAALEPVRPAASRGVRLYGEMVELLWRHSADATMELERLWNEVLRAEGASLLCGYRVDGLDWRLQGVLRWITRSHSHLLPAEDQPRFKRAVDRAYAEVFGTGEDVQTLRALMVTSANLATVMPEAQAAILALETMPPVVANDLRARAHRHYCRA
jgi:hypothetical protein